MKKLVLAVIVIFLLGGAFYFYKNQPQKPAQTTPQTTFTSTDNSTVSKVVDSYYKSYDSCMKNPPAAARGMVSEYCQNNSGLTTTAFVANLEKGGTAKAGADPIFCAQNIPESTTIDPNVQISGDGATAFVNETFGPTQIEIQADLLKENGVWKIDNIICPLP